MDDRMCLVTEYMEGGSLSTNLRYKRVNWYKRGKRVREHGGACAGAGQGAPMCSRLACSLRSAPAVVSCVLAALQLHQLPRPSVHLHRAPVALPSAARHAIRPAQAPTDTSSLCRLPWTWPVPWPTSTPSASSTSTSSQPMCCLPGAGSAADRGSQSAVALSTTAQSHRCCRQQLRHWPG